MGALRLLLQHWRLFGGVILVHTVLTIVFVQGFSATGNLDSTKAAMEETASGTLDQLLNNVVLFTYLAGSSNSTTSDVAGAYQLFLGVITSLALIWALRQLYADKQIRIRDAFYRGMYPLIPFLAVLGVVVLQLVPVVVGGFLYSLVSSATVGLSGIEVTLWALVFGLTVLMSLYMLCSSLFALYIVCLPDMAPLQALRSARELVRYRRWEIIRKLLFLPLALLVCGAAVTIPAIFISTALAGILFFVFNMIGLAVIHSYMYRLYRELL